MLDEGSRKMDRRSTWKTRKVIGLAVFVGLLSFACYVASHFRSRGPIVPGPDTTYVMATVDAEGNIDIVKAFNDAWDPGVPLDENAAPVVLQLAGTTPFLDDQLWQQLAAALELPPERPKEPRFLLFKEYLAELGEEDPVRIEGEKSPSAPLDRMLDDHWEATEHPAIADWLSHNAASLKLLHTVLDRPTYFRPLMPGDDGLLLSSLLPDADLLRWMSLALAVRATQAGDTDQLEQAVADLMLAQRCSSWMAQGPTLIHRAVSAAAANYAFQAERTLLASGSLPSSMARKLRLFVAKFPDPQPISLTIDRGQRLISLDLLLQSYAAPTRPIRSLSAKQLELRGIDWNACLRGHNAVYSEVIDLVAERGKSQFDSRERAFSWEIRRTGAVTPQEFGYLVAVKGAQSAGDVYGRRFAGILMPAFRMNWYWDLRTLKRERLLALGRSLLEYYADHRRFPESLADLTPEYLDPVPDDPEALAGESGVNEFLYGVTDGRAWIRSVGFDGIVDRDTESTEGDDTLLWIAPPPEQTR